MNPYRTNDDSMAQARKLARFRADPKKILITVKAWRRNRAGVATEWIIVVSQRGRRERGPIYVVYSKSPAKGVMKALRDADKRGVLQGIDREMSWTYLYPMGEEGVKNRVPE